VAKNSRESQGDEKGAPVRDPVAHLLQDRELRSALLRELQKMAPPASQS
jgi:hypothetical protein